MVSIYYQATIEKKQCWYFVAVLRSFEHLSFDRTIDKQKNIFEIFTTEEFEPFLLEIIEFFIKENILSNLNRLPNRLATE